MTDVAEPRLPSLPIEQWSDEARAALRSAFPASVADRFLSGAPDAPHVPNAIGTFMYHPRLAGPFLTYNATLLADPALGHRARELLVLRVAARTSSTYEWEQHVRLAPRYGVTDEEIDAIAGRAAAHEWGMLDADLLVAADQLVDHYRVDDDTWQRLAAGLDARQLVELLFVVGTYTCLAMAFNSLGLELDPDLQTSATAGRKVPEE
ncbi:MAG TPA: carboxymuconolactone decarboxylase family protein [Acidimicrobiia bacterium]